MARRELNVFSLSFLDVMSCGFGAVVLIFLIINHSAQEETKTVNKDRLAEVRMLDYQVQQGQKNLFQLQQRMDAVKQRLDESHRKLVSTRSVIESRKEDIQKLQKESMAERSSLNELKSDVNTRERELDRLKASAKANTGSHVRSFTGEGDRQYLTGLKVGGKHVLIALDTSASMLDDKIVNVIRRRNMSDDKKRRSEKWQRAVRTVEWLAAQLPLDANFQIYGFNTEARSLVPEHDKGWIPLGEGRELNAGVEAVKSAIPPGAAAWSTWWTPSTP